MTREAPRSLGCVPFDAFIAIDWSGATGNYDGIAVAICASGRTAPKLVAPPIGKRWTRTAIVAWMHRQLATGKRLLIGFDFAFAFPFEPELGYLAGRAPGVSDPFLLWNFIDKRSCDDDFGCLSFINDAEYSSLFWTAGPKPKKWIDRKRETEHACTAQTLYKMMGSKQVGKASITGMRVLHHIRTGMRGRVAIWPFEKVRHSAIIEIYPTIFRREATGSTAKIRSRSDLNDALKRFGTQPVRKGTFTDHDTDALLSAAGLRSIALNPDCWKRNSPNIRREGWIFGV